jgi:hypothetical protein
MKRQSYAGRGPSVHKRQACLFPEFGLVAPARVEPGIVAAMAADVPGEVEKHPDHEANGREGRNQQKQSQVKIDRHVSTRPSVWPLGPKVDRIESAETGHLQEKPDGVNREQSESKGFINLVAYRKLQRAPGAGLWSRYRRRREALGPKESRNGADVTENAVTSGNQTRKRLDSYAFCIALTASQVHKGGCGWVQTGRMSDRIDRVNSHTSQQ